jgi:hypothetical protein
VIHPNDGWWQSTGFVVKDIKKDGFATISSLQNMKQNINKNWIFLDSASCVSFSSNTFDKFEAMPISSMSGMTFLTILDLTQAQISFVNNFKLANCLTKLHVIEF